MSYFKVIGLCLVALFVGYTLYFLWQQSQPVPTVYELVSPQRRTLVKRTTVAGNMEARRQVDVEPQQAAGGTRRQGAGRRSDSLRKDYP